MKNSNVSIFGFLLIFYLLHLVWFWIFFFLAISPPFPLYGLNWIPCFYYSLNWAEKCLVFFSNSRTNDRHLCRRVHVAYSIEPAARMSRMVEFSSFVKLLHFSSKCILILLRCLIFFFVSLDCVCVWSVCYLFVERDTHLFSLNITYAFHKSRNLSS